ncbi:arabinoxylan arabinofuranohydrolase [Pseudobutyrivibrio sp. 49]|uniref:family 43 glycosylhydrolase n=1 Tax=Pseudobutyrivibrio sp. 49 TaxID=1855344 RepID=UPI00088EB50D|nr:family 43 glycosylhydrolase [Pseudobutyrivibrio sp. 49]SDI11620.1 arabinoxylan arabinofuranohydrolase [Pseudobutyrivibrio sp. 49]
MKKRGGLIGLLAAALVLTGLNPAVAKADNPIVQTIYSTDPAPMVYGDTLYVYTGHDEDGASYYDMRDWHCYSTKDMVNWTDHGVVCSLNTFSWAKSDAWAGQVVERNGKFYYYCPVVAKQGGNSIGVAVSDSPTGPFKDAIGRPLCQGYGFIDPTVYVDSNGQAYLYFGNPNLCYVKLNPNMTSYSGGINKVNLTANSFGYYAGRSSSYEEGPWFYKRGNLYYMVFSGGGIPEHIAYSTSTSPTGPWTYRGVIMPTEGRSFTNHSGIVDFKGHSYFFYHNGALPGGSGFARSVAVEEFKYNPDGSIPTIKMSTSGPSAIATLNPYLKTEAETICYSSGVKTEACGEGTQNVSYIENGDWIKVKNVDFGNGAKSFSARVASAYGGGRIELRLDSTSGRLIGTVDVAKTAGWQSYVTKTCDISGATGKHDLYFVFKGGSGSLMNFNYWQFTPASGTTVQPTPTPTTTPTTSANVNTNSTASISNGWYYLKNTNSQKYLTVEGNKAAAATNVCISTGTGADGQKWYVTNTSDGYITLTSGLGSFMLDVANAENVDGANIGIYHGYSGDAQKFVVKNTKKSGVYTLGTKVSSATKYVDVYEHKKNDGANVCQWLYYGNPNQEWIFEPVDNSTAQPTPTPTPTPVPTQQPTPTPSAAASGLEASIRINSWGSGYTATVKVSNTTGKTVNGWTIKLKKSEVKIDSIWSVNMKESGDYYVITPAEWNSSLSNGASTEFGFNGTGSVGSVTIDIQ